MRTLAIAAFLVIATVRFSHAEVAPSERPREDTTSYRAITLTVDAIALGALVGGMASGDAGWAVIGGLATATVGVPLVHLVRGHRGRAAASLGIRAFALLGVGTTVLLISDSRPSTDPSNKLRDAAIGAVVGFGGSIVAASAIDAVFLTDERVPRTWTPIVSPTHGGARVGIATTF